jgi:dihydroxyacetone kinase-like protein
MRFDPMTLQPDTFKSLVKVAAEQVIASAPELTALDQAIGDGDHGTNMKRGFEAVLSKLDAIGSQPLAEAVKTVGRTLVMTVGGASGPLYGSFFLAAGEALSRKTLPEDLAEVFGSGVDAVSARGRSQAGEKTMLDVLVPVLETLRANAGRADLIERVRATANEAVARTAPMQATRGRASFLGPRSVGHIDPGARSSCVLLHAVCEGLEGKQ